MAGKQFDKSMKLLMVGDSGVGKSCLLVRFVDNQFNAQFITTIGIDFKIKTINLNGTKIKLQIWDTAGQERFRTITTAYYRGAMGIAVVYDVTGRSSFEHLQTWYDAVKQHANDDAKIFFVGNKCDEDENNRQVTTQEGEDFASQLGVQFIEASAKTGTNVEELFIQMATAINESMPDEPSHADDNKIDVQAASNSKGSSSSSCC